MKEVYLFLSKLLLSYATFTKPKTYTLSFIFINCLKLKIISKLYYRASLLDDQAKIKSLLKYHKIKFRLQFKFFRLTTTQITI